MCDMHRGVYDIYHMVCDTQSHVHWSGITAVVTILLVNYLCSSSCNTNKRVHCKTRVKAEYEML